MYCLLYYSKLRSLWLGVISNVYREIGLKVTPFRAQASFAKMMSPSSMPPDQKVKKAEELTYLSINISHQLVRIGYDYVRFG